MPVLGASRAIRISNIPPHIFKKETALISRVPIFPYIFSIHLHIVNDQPIPIALIIGTIAAVDVAPKMYCRIYLLQTTSDLSAGITSTMSLVSSFTAIGKVVQTCGVSIQSVPRTH